jgi:hypothetical protein
LLLKDGQLTWLRPTTSEPALRTQIEPERLTQIGTSRGGSAVVFWPMLHVAAPSPASVTISDRLLLRS